MKTKKLNSNSIVTRNLAEIEKISGNIYESIAIIKSRSNQISSDVKEELIERISGLSNNTVAITEEPDDFIQNTEQIEISRSFENIKPNLLAIEAFLSGQVYFKNPNKESGKRKRAKKDF